MLRPEESGWPDAKRPEVPLNPEQTGWHWLRDGSGEPFIGEWVARAGGFWLWGRGFHFIAARVTYIAPVAPPDTAAQLAAAVAERDRLREACKATLLFHHGGRWDGEKQDRWRRLTGMPDATTRDLCNAVRAALAPEVKP